MPTLGSLVLEMRGDLARLQTDMNKGVSIVERGAASMRAAAGVAKAALGGLATGLVGGLSVGALASVVKNVADYGDRLNDLSKATGASVEQLSFLDYAADQSGSSLEGLTTAIGKMQKNLVDVAKGGAGPAAKALATLKLSASDLAKADLITQIGTIGEALSKVQNPAERAALGMAVVGKSFRDAAPLFAEGRAGIDDLRDGFVRLDAVITTEQGQKFDALNDAIANFKKSIFGVGIAITDSLSGPLTSGFEILTNSILFAKEQTTEFVENLVYGFTEAQKVFHELRADFRSLFSTGGPRDGSSVAISKDLEEAKRLQGVLDQIREDSFNKATRVDARKKLAEAAPAAGVTEGATDAEIKAAERLKKSQQDYLDGLEKQVALQTDSTELAKVLFDIQNDTTGKFDAATTTQAVVLAEQIDAAKEAKAIAEETAEVQQYLNGLVRERNKLEGEATAAQVTRAQSITESLRTPLEAYIDTVKELTDLSKAKLITPETLQRGIKDANTEMVDAQKAASALNGAAKDLGLTFSSAFEDAIVGANKFSDVLKGLAEDITRILVRKSVTEPLANAFGNINFSALFSGFGGGGSMDLGQSIAGYGAKFGFGGGRASGGSVSRGKYYVVGENGPELFAPNVSGAIVPNGGGDSPKVIIYEAPPGTTTRTSANGRDVEVFVGGVMTKNAAAGRNGLRPPLAPR